MSAAAAVTRGRRLAESLMQETCTVSYATGRSVQDEATGREAPVYAVRFASVCKVQARGLSDASSADRSAGGREAVVVSQAVHLPVSAPRVDVGDVVEVTAVGPVSDPQLLGRRFRVVAPVSKSYPTARRFEVEETAG